MSQITPLLPEAEELHLPNPKLSRYFRSAGDLLADEAILLGSVVKKMMLANRVITNKAIILSLILELETTHDVVKADVIRKTLEIIVDHTTDDL